MMQTQLMVNVNQVKSVDVVFVFPRMKFATSHSCFVSNGSCLNSFYPFFMSLLNYAAICISLSLKVNMFV